MPRYIERDLGWRDIKRELIKLDSQAVDIGLYAEDVYPDRPERDAAQIAFWNEYGTKTQPERPFMRTTFDRNEGWLTELCQKCVSNIYSSIDTAQDVIKDVGLAYREMMKFVLLEGPWTPNAPKTVALKGSATPLIETTFMWESIKYKFSRWIG